MTTGVMTMAYGPECYLRMAKGLARSIRLHSPGTPVAVVTDRPPARLRSWFDQVIPVQAAYGPGLAQKLHLDRYRPFDETLFVDSDFLVYSDLAPLWRQLRQVGGVAMFALYLPPGEPHYAVDDLSVFMTKLGISRMPMSNTGVVYLDRSSAVDDIFGMARHIADQAEELGVRRHPAGFFNDEPILAAAVEVLHRPFAMTEEPTVALGSFGTGGMADIDIRKGRSGHIFAGRRIEPVAIHFNVDSQKSRVYDRELRRIEYGGTFGRTPLPDAVTALRWEGRRAATGASRRTLAVARRALSWPPLLDRLPMDLWIRVKPPGTTSALVERAARSSGRPFHVVQVGSNDGRTGDPLFDTIVATEVRAMLIEPVPEMFARLQETYAGKDGVVLVNAAIADAESRQDFYWVPSVEGDPVWVDLLGSFSREVIQSHEAEVPGISGRIRTISVRCRRLSDLLSEHGFDRVDLLHVDAEGADYAVLKSIDFEAPEAPRHILYEHKHLGPDRARARELVEAHGYRTLELHMDTFAYRAQ